MKPQKNNHSWEKQKHEGIQAGNSLKRKSESIKLESEKHSEKFGGAVQNSPDANSQRKVENRDVSEAINTTSRNPILSSDASTHDEYEEELLNEINTLIKKEIFTESISAVIDLTVTQLSIMEKRELQARLEAYRKGKAQARQEEIKFLRSFFDERTYLLLRDATEKRERPQQATVYNNKIKERIKELKQKLQEEKQ